MTLTDLLTQLKPRAQRLKLVDPQTGFVDEDELTAYIQGAMRSLATTYQLQHFLTINRELFRTTDGVESYTLPDTYGFVAPIRDRESGILVSASDGTNPLNLVYYDPVHYNLVRSTTESKPTWFTVTEGLMYLSPIPDAIYIIEAVERAVQEGSTIPAPYAEAIEAETLYQLASDMGTVTPMLVEARQRLLKKMVNDESRFRQRFTRDRERIGQTTRGGRSLR